VEAEAVGQRRRPDRQGRVRAVHQGQPPFDPRRRHTEHVGDPGQLGLVGVRRRHDDKTVGHRQRQAGPPGIGGIGFQDEVVVVGLGLVKVLGDGGSRHRATGLDQPRPAERLVDPRRREEQGAPVAGDLVGDTGDAGFRLQRLRGDRDRDRSGPIPAVVGTGESPHDRPGELQHQPGMGLGEGAECLDAEAGERAVAQGGDGGGAGGSLEQADLADDLAPRDLADRGAPAGDREAAADDEVAGVGVVAFGEQDVAGEDLDDLAGVHDLGAGAGIDVQQVADQLDGPVTIDATPRHRRQFVEGRRVVGEEPLARRPVELADHRPLEGADRRRAGAAGEGGDLANRRPRADDGDAGQIGPAEDLESPLDHEVHLAPGVTFAHQHFPRLQRPDGVGPGQGGGTRVVGAIDFHSAASSRSPSACLGRVRSTVAPIWAGIVPTRLLGGIRRRCRDGSRPDPLPLGRATCARRDNNGGRERNGLSGYGWSRWLWSR
jgi:hypothetical protein